jgi:hypothetical protein
MSTKTEFLIELRRSVVYFSVLLQFTEVFEMQHRTQQHSYRNISGVSQFDAVEKDVNSHVHEIESKVLSIISNLITVQVSQWDARPPVPSQAFRNISRYESVFLLQITQLQDECLINLFYSFDLDSLATIFIFLLS